MASRLLTLMRPSVTARAGTFSEPAPESSDRHVHPAVARGDDAGDDHRAHDVGGERGGVRGQPRRGAGPRVLRGQRAEQCDRDRGLGQDQRQVDRDLQRRGPAVADHRRGRAQGPSHDERERGGEVEAEHERDLAQRDGLRLAPRLHVEDEHVGRGEGERHRPPRQSDVRQVGRQVDEPGDEPAGECEQADGQCGDAEVLGTAGRGTARDSRRPLGLLRSHRRSTASVADTSGVCRRGERRLESAVTLSNGLLSQAGSGKTSSELVAVGDVLPAASSTSPSANATRRPGLGHPADGGERTAARVDRPQVVHLELDRGVAEPGRQRRVHGAPGDGVQQRAHQPAVDDADRVVDRLVDGAAELDAALLQGRRCRTA